MSAGTDIKPCPFCGAALEPFGPAQHNHPVNQCWLRSVRIMDVDRASWNSRPMQQEKGSQ